MRPVKKLMNDIFSRLKLKEKPFRTFESASDEDIEAVWKEIHKSRFNIYYNRYHASKDQVERAATSFPKRTLPPTPLHVLSKEVRGIRL